MRRALPLLLVLACLTFAQRISRAQGDETKIIAPESLWNQMQLQHDADAIGLSARPDPGKKSFALLISSEG